MTRSLRAKFILDLTGNVRGQARRFGGSFERMGRVGQRSFERVGRAADRANRTMNRMAVRGAQIGAVAAVAAGAVALRRLGTLEERLERLGIEAGKSSAEMNVLRDAVNDVAKDAKIRIDPSELLGAFEQIQEKTGDLNFGMAVKREMAIAIQAAGQAGPVIGELVASMYNNLGIRSPEEIRKALDILTLQGRRGQFTIPNLAALGPRIFASFGAFDRGGTAGIAEVGALTQMVRQGTGSAEQATTALEAILRTFLDAEKIKQINTVGRAHGFRATDADGRVRSPLDLLKDLIRSAQGDPVKLSKLFDSEAMRGVLPIAQEFRQTGGFGRLDNLAGIQVNGGELASNAERLAGTLNATGRSVVTNINDRVEDALLEPLTKLTESINALLDAGIELTADDALNLALGTAGVALGVKGTAMALGRGGRRGRGVKGSKAGTSGLASGLAGAGGVVPVFVTNFPSALGGSGAGVDRGSKSRSRSSRTSARGGRLIGAGRVIGAGLRFLGPVGLAFLAADLARDPLSEIADIAGSPRLNTKPLTPVQRAASEAVRRSNVHTDAMIASMTHGSVGAPGFPTLPGSGRAFPSGDGDLKGEMARFVEAQQDTADETTRSGQDIVAELRQIRVVLRNLQQRDRVAIGAAPETGRILTGPQ